MQILIEQLEPNSANLVFSQGNYTTSGKLNNTGAGSGGKNGSSGGESTIYLAGEGISINSNVISLTLAFYRLVELAARLQV